jgi:hypothetical protein
MKCIIRIVGLLVILSVTAAAQFTPWSAPLNAGAPINTQYMDTCVSISKSGLSMYFASNRHTGNAASADWDLYVSRRESADSPWQEPQRLPNVNVAGWMDSCPALSMDEHRLFFVSTRPGPCGPSGTSDLYLSRRRDRNDDLGWGEPQNLGCVSQGFVNSASSEWTPTLFEDDNGNEILYFSSDSLSPGNFDLLTSRLRRDGTFGPPSPVSEINTIYTEQGFAVRRDGLEMIFGSNRPGSLSDSNGNRTSDLWHTTRQDTSEPWAQPTNLTGLNSDSFDGGKMTFSFDGRTIYFRSNRGGGHGSGDIYYATREKLQGPRR